MPLVGNDFSKDVSLYLASRTEMRLPAPSPYPLPRRGEGAYFCPSPLWGERVG